MYFHCVFFHTILTVPQNTQIAHLTIIPEGCSVYLVVVFLSVPPLGDVLSPHRVIIPKLSIQ